MSLPRFSVENPVLVNMLMVGTLVAGGFMALTLVREMFPESRPNAINIRAVYPAVQPQELERAITIKIEEAVRDVEGVEKVDSTVSEGVSATKLTLFNSVTDVDSVLQEVKNEVDALQDLPDDLEKITVYKSEPTLPVIMVAVYGEGSEADLKTAARDIKDDLLRLPGVSDVILGGSRPYEISVEVRPDKLLEYDVTFEEVAQAIRQTNLDVSAGNLQGAQAQIAVRTLGEELTGKELEDIEVRSLSDGRTIHLRDVATVIDGFADVDVRSYWGAGERVQRSFNLIVQKTSAQDAIQIALMVKAYIAGKSGEPFDPYGLERINALSWWERPLARVTAHVTRFVEQLAGRPDAMAVYEQSRAQPFSHHFKVGAHTDLARFVEGRLDLLLRDGKQGLVLVLVCLLLFTNWRLAFWTAMGIPPAFLGAFILMAAFGVSINLLSMFGLIIVSGIMVDDAIVIGENIYRHVEEGMPAREAAIIGTEEVQWPVVICITCTISAFAPLLFLKGQIGDFMRVLPLVVIAALAASLLEALLVLPSHLSHLPRPVPLDDASRSQSAWGRIITPVARVQGRMIAALMSAYGRVLHLALRWRYVSLGIAVGCCIATLGLVVGINDGQLTLGNIVKWEFIQKMDAESLFAHLELPVGANAEESEARLRDIADFAVTIPEVESVQIDVAMQLSLGEIGATGVNQQSHLGQVWVELLAADHREREGLRSSEEVLADLRRHSESLEGVNSVTWEAMSGGPGGKDIEVRLSGDDMQELKEMSAALKGELATYAGVVDLDDNLDEGRQEVQLSLRAAARPTGITRQMLGMHVRGATYGVEARRITRDREDVKIMVRYPEANRTKVGHIESMWVPASLAAAPGVPVAETERDAATRDAATGRGWVPLTEVARLEEARGFTQIHRSQQQRALTVSGNINADIVKPNDVINRVKQTFIPQLQREHPNVRVEFLGSQEEQAKSFDSLRVAMPIALLLIYVQLAGLFQSYTQPLVVMSAIPFAFQGALIGHYLTGYPATFLSAIGLVALTGMVVNDSLVLMEFINQRLKAGDDELEASWQGSVVRLRPIILTTVTTVAGLTPLMFETSFQAKFLIPIAVTLTFGLGLATLVTLVIVPVLNMIFFDIRRAARQGWKWVRFGGSSLPEPAPIGDVA